MALFTPSESPAVVVKEIDLTGGVPNVQSTTGATVGNFRWGPVLKPKLISNEAELVSTFGSPTDTNAVDFLTASQFLKYSSSLYVTRNMADSDGSGVAIGTAFALSEAASISDSDNDLINPQILNSDDFDAREATLAALRSASNKGIQFAAKYPGALGNSLSVEYMPAQLSVDSNWNDWTYNSYFNVVPSTSSWASGKGSGSDEMSLVVIDKDGLISGSSGTVLETFGNLSILKDAKDTQGLSLYAKEVINKNSQYIWMLNFDSDQVTQGAGDDASLNINYYCEDSSGPRTLELSKGADTGILSTGDAIEAFDVYEDKDTIELDFLIAPETITSDGLSTVVNDLVATAQSTRKDCMVVTSPNRGAIVGVVSDATKTTNITSNVANLTRSSYLVVDNNYLKVYDKYNDKYVFIPAASTTAGIMAATDYNQAPWFSPAGSRRGQLLGVTSLAYSPTKAQRDTLYRAGVNPIANIPGQGVLLFGDKTFLSRTSAFDRINVRRLFLVLERAIGRAAEQVLFEFNDEFTRAEFVNIVEPVLREVQGRRGITDFRVVCDETNNTAAVVDRNEFIASIFIKPARSINYVTLNFVAVRTGVDFEEVVGTV